ncbi:MAG: DUF2127 domain-containing protein [Thermoleophilaceae bacterium]
MEEATQPLPGTTKGRRFRPKFHYELIDCGLQGHELFGTDARDVRPEDYLLALEQGGIRWHRCVRCDSWLPLSPPADPSRESLPSRDEIELPLRGKPLRDKYVLRLIAIDRAFHFLVLGILGLAILLFATKQAELRGPFYKILTDLQRGVAGGPIQNDRAGFLGELNKAFSLRSKTLHLVGLVICAYALLEGIEAVGLWLQKRWAEYLTFVATTALLPLEVIELSHKLTPTKVIALIINVAVVIYLIYAKRLFGVRGGGAAEQREREQDIGWRALERATPGLGKQRPPVPSG